MRITLVCIFCLELTVQYTNDERHKEEYNQDIMQAWSEKIAFCVKTVTYSVHLKQSKWQDNMF